MHYLLLLWEKWENMVENTDSPAHFEHHRKRIGRRYTIRYRSDRITTAPAPSDDHVNYAHPTKDKNRSKQNYLKYLSLLSPTEKDGSHKYFSRNAAPFLQKSCTAHPYGKTNVDIWKNAKSQHHCPFLHLTHDRPNENRFPLLTATRSPKAQQNNGNSHTISKGCNQA